MRFLRALLVLLIIMTLCGCHLPANEPISKSGFYFDTMIQITLYDSKDYSLIDSCFSYCEEFENLVSRTVETSDISRINHAAGAPVKVSDTTIELLKTAIYYGDLTNGAFDITVAPLTTLWDFKNNPGEVPNADDIVSALSHVNYKTISIDGNTVTMADPLASIDLGGIAKGYMADRLKSYLKSEGVKSALINLGGNILTIGSKSDDSPFRIGIQKPFDEKNATITSVLASDSSVVTSGSYERYFKANNQIYHHILDTKTGYPCDNNLASVTILSNESLTGDILSTACFALGTEDGMKLIHSLDDIEAIFITMDYKIIDSRDK